jgi:hypothetical protein
MIKIMLIGSLIAATSSPPFAQDRRAVDSNGHVDRQVPSQAAPPQNQANAPDTVLEPGTTIDD